MTKMRMSLRNSKKLYEVTSFRKANSNKRKEKDQKYSKVK